jgi:diketogulonate reductase-like aldo/keto reductase
MSAADMIRPLCDVKRRGLARHIGLSNFNVALLEEAWQATSEPIVANQCEYHPHLNQDRVIAVCRKAGTALVAYCPLGRAKAFAEPAVASLARAKERTPAQIVLRWHLQQSGVAAIPKTRSAARLKENLDVFGFTLSDAEMSSISALTVRHDRICDASWPRWDP